MTHIYSVSKKDLILGYMANIFRYAGNFIVLPFLVSNVSTELLAIWNIFLAINGFIILFDMGFGVVIARYIMYSYSGAISIDNINIENQNKPNYKLLFHLFISAKKIYKYIASISIIILSLLSGYILYISAEKLNITIVTISWILFSISVVINMYFLAYSNVIKGLGLVGKLQQITLINSIIAVIFKIIFLILGFELLGLSISILINSIILAIQYFVVVNEFKLKNIEKYKEALQSYKDFHKNNFMKIKDKSIQIGKVLISKFVQSQLFTLIAPIFISLELLGEYSLSYQLLNMVAAFSGIIISMYTMKIGNYMIKKNKEALRKSFSISMSIFIFLFVIGSIIVILFGNLFLELINSNTYLLDIKTLIILASLIFVNQIISKTTNIISLTDNQEYVNSLLITSIITIVLNVILLSCNFSLYIVLLVNMLLSLIYNFWKWFLKCMKICDTKFIDLIVLPIGYIKSILKKEKC